MRRRRFLVGGAATACVACAACGGDDAESAAPSSTAPSTSAPGSAPPGFGSRVDVGSLDDVLAEIDEGNGFRYVPEARAFLVRYPAEALEAARSAYDEETVDGLALGLLAVYQKCTHLGCRVPECTSSGRFECACHGAVFNGVGEYVSGPAPRGLDRFVVSVSAGRVSIDTSTTLPGLERGQVTVESGDAGPSCLPSSDASSEGSAR